jgi:hypothetical protein
MAAPVGLHAVVVKSTRVVAEHDTLAMMSASSSHDGPRCSIVRMDRERSSAEPSTWPIAVKTVRAASGQYTVLVTLKDQFGDTSTAKFVVTVAK